MLMHSFHVFRHYKKKFQYLPLPAKKISKDFIEGLLSMIKIVLNLKIVFCIFNIVRKFNTIDEPSLMRVENAISIEN